MPHLLVPLDLRSLNWLLVGLFALLFTCSLPFAPLASAASWQDQVEKLAGSKGIVLAVDESGATLLDVGGSEKSFIPASMLKIATTLLAAEYLGMESRFVTEFFLKDDLLVVRGQGDPMLVSEELDLVVAALKPLLAGAELAGVGIDNSHFIPGIKIPGVGSSEQPYDALNSATAVNFNTINVVVEGNDVRSAESQTPITPLARTVAKRRGVQGKLRVNLSSNPEESQRYTAELVAAKLRGVGVQVGDRYEQSQAGDLEPLYRHQSSKTVADACAALLYYSNNYIANQIFLAVGAAHSGAPASLEKSVAAVNEYIAKHPQLEGLVMTEGSGISYKNRVTAQVLVAALTLFEPHKALLRAQHSSPSKTGTLKITRSVAGYLETESHGVVRYVVSLDGGGSRRRWKIVDIMKKAL